MTSASTTVGTPLDKKQIRSLDSTAEVYPALHEQWMSKSRFVAYVAPPLDTSDQGQMGEWLERLSYIAKDLHWLLQLSHQKFWCQVIFDDSLHQMLDSFLHFAPRPYDLMCELPNNARTLHDQVSRLVFLTYVRMATYKESKENWLTPEVFGDIIYQNFLFDIPKMMDLCALYAGGNTPLLSKMIANVFNHQPHYMDDLRATVNTILQVFSSISAKCGVENESLGLSPQKLQEAPIVRSSILLMEEQDYQDVLFYLLDTAVTLANFLAVFPSACSVLHEFHICQSLAHFYDSVIPAFQNSMKNRHFKSLRQKDLWRKKLRQARRHLLEIFHMVLAHTCLQPVLDNLSTPEAADKFVEDFLSTMSGVLSERRFLADYEGQFSFQDDLDILSQAAGLVDEAHYKYIQEAINSAFAAHGQRKKPKGNMNTGGRTSPDGSPCPPMAQGKTVTASTTPLPSTSPAHQHNDHTEGASAYQPTDVELDSLICAVKDLLPDLGNGFIEEALEELQYSPENVINAILENKLPDKLQHLDQKLERREPVSQEPENILLESRRNIFDNDDFDVFSKDSIDMDRIHKGKRNQDASLDDKESIIDLKPLYNAYGNMDVPSMYDPQLYDDEYDDTYDTNTVGADDADSADELTQRRPFVIPKVLQQKEKQQEEESEESSEEEEEESQDRFMEDPAKIRARREQTRIFHQQKQGEQPKYDVKGRGRGQGQSKDVLQNRRWKEKNKGARANHNRRALADRKMNKGMF